MHSVFSQSRPWLIASILIAAAAWPVATHAGEREEDPGITAVVRGLRSDHGRVSGGLYDSPGTFTQSGQEVATCSVPIRNGVARCRFDNVPPGRYGIAVMHDEDADGEFDTGFLGIPEEGYGFSRDASGTLGPPSFDSAAFDWNASADGTVVLTIRYGI